MRLFYFTFTLFLIVCSVSICSALAQETVASKQNLPEISNVEPREIAPGMALKIEGYRLGAEDSSKIIFIQNAEEFEGNRSGASWEAADVSQGLQELNVTVPEEILAGKCQIIIEHNGQRSLPFTVEVAQLPKPPKLKSVQPLIAIPGESIWIDGIGFNIKDTVELLDASGKTHIVELGDTSSAETGSFTLKDEIPDGLVTLKVIENRSGLKQASNSLTFRVKRTGVPLDLWEEDLDSVAPGQWFELVYTSDKPLEKATKIEFLLRQGFNEQISFVTDFKNVRVQIPKSFTPGKIEIQNRVWINKEASEWSKPIEYEVAGASVKPKIWSFANIPLRAEAMFKQNGSVVATLPIVFGIYPETSVPEKLKDGQLEIFTRFWKDGKFTDWKQDRTFDFQKSKFSEKSFQFPNFNEYFQIGNDSPEVFQINRGENLRIEGEFFVGSADELQIILENEGQRFVLKPSVEILFARMLVKVPRNIRARDWSVSIANINKQVTTEIPVKLRIN